MIHIWELPSRIVFAICRAAIWRFVHNRWCQRMDKKRGYLNHILMANQLVICGVSRYVIPCSFSKVCLSCKRFQCNNVTNYFDRFTDIFKVVKSCCHMRYFICTKLKFLDLNDTETDFVSTMHQGCCQVTFLHIFFIFHIIWIHLLLLRIIQIIYCHIAYTPCMPGIFLGFGIIQGCNDGAFQNLLPVMIDLFWEC